MENGAKKTIFVTLSSSRQQLWELHQDHDKNKTKKINRSSASVYLYLWKYGCCLSPSHHQIYNKKETETNGVAVGQELWKHLACNLLVLLFFEGPIFVVPERSGCSWCHFSWHEDASSLPCFKCFHLQQLPFPDTQGRSVTEVAVSPSRYCPPSISNASCLRLPTMACNCPLP